MLVILLLYIFTTYVGLFLPKRNKTKKERKPQLTQQIHLGFLRESGNDQLHWYRDFLQPIHEWQNNEEQTTSRKKFIFAFRYYEQLGRATENLLALCSLAKYGGREVVAPFVNNSRMAGIPHGVGHHFRRKRVVSFSPFETYFNLQKVNDKLKNSGYGTLTSFDEMAHFCNRRLNIAVHFLYHERKSIEDAASWYRIRERDLQAIYIRARQNDGWTNCPHIRKSDIGKQLGGFKVSRYVCVDPEIIRSLESLENRVFQGAYCVGIVQWKGVGSGRTHFPLSSTINTFLRPSDLEHNSQLISMARTFIQTSGLGKSFISVHVRAERHIFRRGENVTRQCFHKLASRVEKLTAKHDWKVYLSSDIVDHGSDTLIQDVSHKQRFSLYEELMKVLKYPITLSRIDGLYDTGALAIIEMHILSLGKKLVTLGGGNYQEWIIQLFSRNVHDISHSLHRVCELR